MQVVAYRETTMKTFAACCAAFAGLAAFAGPALAADGRFLTISGDNAAPVMTAGVRMETISGVRLFRGSAPVETQLLGGEPAAPSKIIRKTVIVERPWRTFRRLRTQGFYSGVPYPSRGYTQGFYSTGR